LLSRHARQVWLSWAASGIARNTVAVVAESHRCRGDARKFTLFRARSSGGGRHRNRPRDSNDWRSTPRWHCRHTFSLRRGPRLVSGTANGNPVRTHGLMYQSHRCTQQPIGECDFVLATAGANEFRILPRQTNQAVGCGSLPHTHRAEACLHTVQQPVGHREPTIHLTFAVKGLVPSAYVACLREGSFMQACRPFHVEFWYPKVDMVKIHCVLREGRCYGHAV